VGKKLVVSKKCHLKNKFTEEFLAAAGSNDHFFVGVGAVPSLVQFDRRPLGGANFQHCAITQPCNATITQQNNHATLQHNNHATINATITQQ
jgi:hypothetical protein